MGFKPVYLVEAHLWFSIQSLREYLRELVFDYCTSLYIRRLKSAFSNSFFRIRSKFMLSLFCTQDFDTILNHSCRTKNTSRARLPEDINTQSHRGTSMITQNTNQIRRGSNPPSFFRERNVAGGSSLNMKIEKERRLNWVQTDKKGSCGPIREISQGWLARISTHGRR